MKIILEEISNTKTRVTLQDGDKEKVIGVFDSESPYECNANRSLTVETANQIAAMLVSVGNCVQFAGLSLAKLNPQPDPLLRARER